VSGVDCPTWLSIVLQFDISTSCSLCPAPAIDNCGTQSGDVCLECAEGYAASEMQDACLLADCAEGTEASLLGDCVVPLVDCAPGYTNNIASGSICEMCKPGFELNQGMCLALPDPENCAEVELSNPERTCNVCNPGYYAGPYGKCHQEDTATCQDSDNGATDSYGDNCDGFTANPGWCGTGDDEDFKSTEMCCVCKSNPTPQPTPEPTPEPATCEDSDNGATDSYGDNCEGFTANPGWCGTGDDEDFKSTEMCCVCKNNSSLKHSWSFNNAKKVTKSTRKTKTLKRLNTNARKTQKKNSKSKKINPKNKVKALKINSKKMPRNKKRTNNRKLSKN
jgi:hypothetical protein